VVLRQKLKIDADSPTHTFVSVLTYSKRVKSPCPFDLDIYSPSRVDPQTKLGTGAAAGVSWALLLFRRVGDGDLLVGCEIAFVGSLNLYISSVVLFLCL